MVLLILTSPRDSEAPALVANWSMHQAAVLTCSDLSTTGWRYAPGDVAASSFAVAGKALPARNIAVVLTRAPTIDPTDLVDVAAGDRDYVAAEMHAFLVAWLTSLGPRVVNRPTPHCLLGPLWSPEVWVRLAATLGIPVRPTRRSVGPDGNLWTAPPPTDPRDVTVVGNAAFGDVHIRVKEHALALAHAAGTDLLSVTFDGPEPSAGLVSANPRPPLDAREMVDAVEHWLVGAPR
jgi:hypothetical protein